MNRSPKVGDVIKLPKSRSEWIVVYSKREMSEDRIRNEEYYADVFKVIKFLDLGKSNPTVRVCSVKENSSMHVGDEFSIKDIEFVQQMQLVERVVTTYMVRK